MKNKYLYILLVPLISLLGSVGCVFRIVNHKPLTVSMSCTVYANRLWWVSDQFCKNNGYQNKVMQEHIIRAPGRYSAVVLVSQKHF